MLEIKINKFINTDQKPLIKKYKWFSLPLSPVLEELAVLEELDIDR